jgi:hypothetical protein
VGRGGAGQGVICFMEVVKDSVVKSVPEVSHGRAF